VRRWRGGDRLLLSYLCVLGTVSRIGACTRVHEDMFSAASRGYLAIGGGLLRRHTVSQSCSCVTWAKQAVADLLSRCRDASSCPRARALGSASLNASPPPRSWAPCRLSASCLSRSRSRRSRSLRSAINRAWRSSNSSLSCAEGNVLLTTCLIVCSLNRKRHNRHACGCWPDPAPGQRRWQHGCWARQQAAPRLADPSRSSHGRRCHPATCATHPRGS